MNEPLQRRRPRVLVAGGGIGGLTAASALRGAGCEVEVFERAPELQEVGAGIALSHNALQALEALGLREAIAAAGQPTRRFRLATTRGTLVAHDLADLLGVEVAVVGIHRAVLQATLAAALPAASIHLDSACRAYEATPEGVALELEDGRRVEGDLLVGADGIHSCVRRQLQDDPRPPRYAGYTCWRGIVAGDAVADLERDAMFEVWGPDGARFGGVFVDAERLYWFAPVNAPRGGQDAPGTTHATLAAAYRRWPEWVRRLIAATPEEAIVRNDIGDRPFCARWGEGRVTLLGDAAHAMTPNMGQGACQAIEDALVLGRCLTGAADLPAALRAYERLRIPRARSFVVQSWRAGRVGQLESRVLRFARDAALRAVAWLTPRLLLRRQTRRLLRLPYGELAR